HFAVKTSHKCGQNKEIERQPGFIRAAVALSVYFPAKMAGRCSGHFRFSRVFAPAAKAVERVLLKRNRWTALSLCFYRICARPSVSTWLQNALSCLFVAMKLHYGFGSCSIGFPSRLVPAD